MSVPSRPKRTTSTPSKYSVDNAYKDVSDNEEDEFMISSDRIPSHRDDSDSDVGFTPRRSRKRKRKSVTVRKGHNLPYVANVTVNATDVMGSENASTSKLEAADASTVSKIKKALALASHEGTGEDEAKAAMRMASKLMQKENLTQADLIANETAEERANRAGHSIVTITSLQGKQVRQHQWHDMASDAVDISFNVKSYSTGYVGKHRLDWVFYGLAANTAAAAMSFEMLHNQILTWTAERQRGKEIKGQVGANNYKLGVAERVRRDAEKEVVAQEKQAKEEERKRLKRGEEEERAKRREEIARLQVPLVEDEEATPRSEENSSKVKLEVAEDEDMVPKPTPAMDSVKMEDDSSEDEFPEHLPQYTPAPPDGQGDCDEDDSDSENDNMSDIEIKADFQDGDDDEMDLLDLDSPVPKVRKQPEEDIKPASAPAPETEIKAKLQPDEPTGPPLVTEHQPEISDAWCSAVQLFTFRENAQNIADEYLKQKDIKVSMKAAWKESKYDHDAFSKGWRDGMKVDLKRRKIEE